MRVGVDTGGTFTDVVAEDGRIVKVPSSRADPSASVSEAIGALGRERPALLAHGTTVATNALLERRGGTVALVTTTGFADVIEIARQDRPSLYDPFADRPIPLVPRSLRFEVGGRLAADGTELELVDPASVPPLPDGVDAVAVCLLHADLNPTHERLVAAVLSNRGYDVTASHELSPEFREYERTVTTVVNAYVRPVCRDYLRRLGNAADEVVVGISSGGLVPVAEATARAAALLLSGPAGGVRAASTAAVEAGFADAVSFDMGGTSTDVCLILDGAPAPAAQRSVGGFPIRLPALDIHTIGAGGGSIARIDAGGALTVGPESAGADPGPACYGRGGTEPTVTDADLVAGRIAPGTAFSGLGSLDIDASALALAEAGVTADGVLAVVDEAMVQAVRAVTVERGVDPRGLALVAFGGAGPLHACAIASALGMAAVVVPPRAGVLSALGLLGSPRQADLVLSWPHPYDHDSVAEARFSLARDAARKVRGLDGSAHARVQVAAGTGEAAVTFPDGVVVEVEMAVDCRYRGQSHELTVPTIGGFEDEHRRRNGFVRSGEPIEVTALRASARLPAPLALGSLPPPAQPRHPGAGPRVLSEPDCTVWLPDGWTATVTDGGSWVLRPDGRSS